MANLDTCTSSTRPGSPTTGDMLYETDTQDVILYNGSAWKSYTPDVAPYDLDGTNVLSVSPTFHLDAGKINGVDTSGNPSNGANLTGTWTSLLNDVYTKAQATGSLQPVWNNSGTNSKPYFGCTADALYFYVYNQNLLVSDDYTIFWVGTKTADGTAYAAIGGQVATSKGTWMNFSNGNDYLYFASTGASSSKARPTFASGVGNGSTAVATYEVTRMFLQTRDSSDNGDLWVDGNNQNSSLASTASDAWVWDQLLRTGASYAHTGNLYEVACFNSDLSTADRNKLIAYVNTKYGTGRNADDSDDLARATF